MASGNKNTTAAPKIDYNKGHLGANNFTIGHDSSVTKDNLQSVFKQDYPYHDHYGRMGTAQLPKLGDVMHKDDRFYERASETVTAFEYRSLTKPVLLDVANKFSHTNFKMDSDTSKVDSFNTSHQHYFKPKMGDIFNPLPQKITSWVSTIPQGDKEKAELPISDYKYKFPGIDTNNVKVDRAKNMHHGGAPTIKGDDRLGHFDSSSKSQFDGTWAPKVKILPVPPSYNVPVGDPEKENSKVTVMQSSFMSRSPDERGFTPFDCVEASQKLRRTNYKEKDGHGVWDNYLTTASSSFIPKTLDNTPSAKMRHRNTSDFPEGDRQPLRDKERMSLTTQRFHHGSPALGIHNTIVSGAEKRVASKVWFGDPVLNKFYYNTSMKDGYETKSVTCMHDRHRFYTPSAIPLNYYGNKMFAEATMSHDYTDPKQDRMILNPDALSSLQSSHIPPPQKHMTFDTTHNDEFKPKTTKRHLYDSGRLQKSSVPLGTMAI